MVRDWVRPPKIEILQLITHHSVDGTILQSIQLSYGLMVERTSPTKQNMQLYYQSQLQTFVP